MVMATPPTLQPTMHPDWIIPDWPAPKNVQAVFTTRSGGQSRGVYSAMNLGDHVQDNPSDVLANRVLLEQTLAVRPVFLSQVHGVRALALSAQTPNGVVADASYTHLPQLACAIMVADCLPILLTDDQGTFVAGAHAGWRGLAGQSLSGDNPATVAEKFPGCLGVLEALLGQNCPITQLDNGFNASKVIAWLGPCIGPQAFEVGPEVKAAFEMHDPEAASCFKAGHSGKYLADLAGLARQRLNALGISKVFGNDSTLPWCTVSNPSRFFSYRRDGMTGRMAAFIWRC